LSLATVGCTAAGVSSTEMDHTARKSPSANWWRTQWTK